MPNKTTQKQKMLKFLGKYGLQDNGTAYSDLYLLLDRRLTQKKKQVSKVLSKRLSDEATTQEIINLFKD